MGVGDNLYLLINCFCNLSVCRNCTDNKETVCKFIIAWKRREWSDLTCRHGRTRGIAGDKSHSNMEVVIAITKC